MSDPHSTAEHSATDAVPDAVAEEQVVIDELYRRLDALRAERVEMRDRYVSRHDNTPGGRVERDLAYANHAAAVIALNAAEDRLCFGRIDRTDGESMHIGRMGIFADSGDRRQLLMDWRAPSARPFYVATAASPLGLRRRRYITTKRRRVQTANDEYLDLSDPDALAQARAAGGGPAGEAELFAALRAPRTGRMSDIVATIQAEQDRIIRSELNGILVVQGGPGTGKTAVALHRAAYLLYNHRDQLQQRGVLIIGPNPTFLDYIGQVLPALGEDAVVLSTIATLFPGVSAQTEEHPAAARVKGRTAMIQVIANAVLHRQALPRNPIEVAFDGAPGGRLVLNGDILRPARDRAWASRRPHNQARPLFVRRVIDGLVRQVAARLGTGKDGRSLATADDLAAIRQDLIEHEGLRVALRDIWPALSAPRLLADLFGSADRIEFAAEHLRPRDRELLLRADNPAGWTPADVPLLDEAAELLGPMPTASASFAAAADQEYAAEVLDLLGADDDLHPDDAGLQGMLGMVNAATLAGLHDEVADWTSTAERAAADREWTYGHVIVDEAQELSAMAWRMVMRRCPMRSMTLVGDLAQTSDPAGALSWSRMLRPYVRGRFAVEELTVNYRTPAEIMTIAEPVLAAIDPELQPPRSVRDAGVRPAHRRVAPSDLAAQVVDVVRDDDDEPGTVAVIVPRSRFVAVADAVERARNGGPALDPVGPHAQPSLFEMVDTVTDLRRHVVVLTVMQAKGLEFDSVILADPAGIIAESDRGLSDLYVALTRTTQRLTVLHTGDLPAVLGRLREPAA